MSFKAPEEATAAAVAAGEKKAARSWDRALVGGFLAGAYVAFGGLFAVCVTSGLDAKTWGTLPTLFFGAAFSLGLILVVLGGADLLTGNMALLPIALFRRRIGGRRLAFNWTWVLLGNLAGSLFVAYVLAVKTGVIGSAASDPASAAGMTFAKLEHIALAKGVDEGDLQVFLRAIGCNWLVNLAIWLALAATDVAGKILAIVFPITAFVAMGFDHVVANMFFLPAAMFAHVPGLGWWDVGSNLLLAFAGNLVGGVVFVAGAYWYLHLHGSPEGLGDAGPLLALRERMHAPHWN